MVFFLFKDHVQADGENNEKRIDLIKFYNTIFVQVVKDNALKYSTNSVSYWNLYKYPWNVFFSCIYERINIFVFTLLDW